MVGFKTGPKTWDEGRRLVLEEGARFAEVWYRYDRPEDYQTAFQFFRDRGVGFGLHYWGTVGDGILPSFCHPEPKQYQAGLGSVKQAIDVAAEAGAVYVNIHPGTRALTRIGPHFRGVTLVNESVTPVAEAFKLLSAATKQLHDYASDRKVVFLVETVPACDWGPVTDDEAQRPILKTYHASVPMIEALAEQGFEVANDFGHTAAALPSTDRAKLWDWLLDKTERLAPRTRLLHINTLSEPFSGTDTHDGILAEDWAHSVFPNEEQFLQLLAIFKNRQDVWLIPEPKDGLMRANYLALQKYCRALGMI